VAEGAPALLGLVLAGGRSERLGTDKAAVVLDGQPLLARAVALLQAVVADIRVAARPDQADDDLRRRFRLVADDLRGIGPAAGILAAHAAQPDAAWLVMACDMPRVDAGDLARLVAAREPARGATAFRGPRDGRPEPLCAIYEPATLARFRRQVTAGGSPSPRELLENCGPVLLEAPAADRLDSINTREDLQRLAPGASGRPAE
jgi:molybdenum cofactor guanylyltransferase